MTLGLRHSLVGIERDNLCDLNNHATGFLWPFCLPTKPSVLWREL